MTPKEHVRLERFAAEELDLNQDEKRLLFEPFVWVGWRKRQESLLWATSPHPDHLAWKVIRCLHDSKVKIHPTISMVVITSDKRVSWQWGLFRPPVIQEALSLFGLLGNSSYEEWSEKLIP